MVGIKNYVLVLSVTILAACVTQQEPVVMAAAAQSIDGDEDAYEIVCAKEEQVGSRIDETVCRIVYAKGSALGIMDDIHKADRLQEMANAQRPKDR
jgi:hypothetical protein